MLNAIFAFNYLQVMEIVISKALYVIMFKMFSFHSSQLNWVYQSFIVEHYKSIYDTGELNQFHHIVKGVLIDILATSNSGKTITTSALYGEWHLKCV